MIRRILRTSTGIATVCTILCALASPLMVRGAAAQEALKVPDGLPDWTFNIPDKEQPSAVKPEGIVKAPGSPKEYEWSKVAGNANPPDWFPDEHPPAPKAVTGGPGIRFACGACHLMSGQGHPKAADIAGMPAEYLIRQMAYYKAGTRKDDSRMTPIAKATSDEDIRQAAEYFASSEARRLREGDRRRRRRRGRSSPPRAAIVSSIPTAAPSRSDAASSKSPQDPYRTEIRDPHSGFIAYVPPGSIAKGEALVKGGESGKTMPCAICHGETLKGAAKCRGSPASSRSTSRGSSSI